MILCVGTTPVYQRSMLFDSVALDEVNRAREVHDYASGKSINVARVVKTLGGEPIACGFVGGSRGELLCRDLDRAKVPHDFVRVEAETRQCVTVIDRAAGTATELVEESAFVAPGHWAELDRRLKARLAGAKVWVFSGTIAPGGPADFYARWLPLADRHGARAVIDIRGEPMRLAMRHPNGILKLNREELAATLGEDLTPDDRLARAVREHAPAEGVLIVTLGPAGAIAGTRERVWRSAAPSVSAVSAVGSGDAFAAGLALALERSEPLDSALRLATAAGTANAMTPLAGHLDPEVCRKLRDQVTVETLA